MEIKKTITSIFMVPTLQIPKNCLKDNGFINGYSSDSAKESHYKDCVYILFKPPNLDKFREFLESEYERTANIVEDYDYDEGYVVVVYKLNEEFSEDFKLIKMGKYSKTSVKYQNAFPKSVKIITNGLHRDELALQIRIFKKTTDLVEFWEERLGVDFNDEQEVWDMYDLDKEILILDKIKEYE